MLFITLMLTSSILNDRLSWIFNSITIEAQATHNTSTNIRLAAIKYYYSELKKTSYLGYGYYSPDHVSNGSKLAYGQEFGFYEGDLGVIMTFLMYGIQGIIWTIIMYYILLKDLIRARCLPDNFQMIRKTLIMILFWSILFIHNFVWAYHEAFWWGILFFLIYYISKKDKISHAINNSASTFGQTTIATSLKY
ncbi:MAG: hypothetical protein GY710_08740 [Desulfobacteraceae bacterium]|nr:hypothetical protein [Desulfobacteraceae bacterium]